MGIFKLVEILRKPLTFKDKNGKEESAFLKTPSSSQIDYFSNNLNASIYNMERRYHQQMIAYASLVTAPLIFGEDFKQILMDVHCNYERCFKDEDEGEMAKVLFNLAKITKVKARNVQKRQMKNIIDCASFPHNEVYRNMIAPMFGYKVKSRQSYSPS